MDEKTNIMKEKMCALTRGIIMIWNKRIEPTMSYSIQSVQLGIMKNKNATKIWGRWFLAWKSKCVTRKWNLSRLFGEAIKPGINFAAPADGVYTLASFSIH